MAGILAQIFGTQSVIDKGLQLIDDAWETDAEKLEARAAAKIKLMSAYAPFKLAQRYLAVMFSTAFLVCFFLVLVMTLFDIGNAKVVFEVVEVFNVGWIMTVIITFYFGGGLVSSYKGKD